MVVDFHCHFWDLFSACSECLPEEGKSEEKCLEFFKSMLSRDCFYVNSFSGTEYRETISLLEKTSDFNIIPVFGIHPQNPEPSQMEILSGLIEKKMIYGIGECGFDMFTPEYALTLENQKMVWDFQLDEAVKKQLPMIIHVRKALPLIFGHIPDLKKVPAVIFHGWPGSPVDAESLLKKGVNAFFSFGKALLQGRKNSLETLKFLPPERILTETDFPFMTLKNQDFTRPVEIEKIKKFILDFKSLPESMFEEILLENCCNIFGLKGV